MPQHWVGYLSSLLYKPIPPNLNQSLCCDLDVCCTPPHSMLKQSMNPGGIKKQGLYEVLSHKHSTLRSRINFPRGETLNIAWPFPPFCLPSEDIAWRWCLKARSKRKPSPDTLDLELLSLYNFLFIKNTIKGTCCSSKNRLRYPS